MVEISDEVVTKGIGGGVSLSGVLAQCLAQDGIQIAAQLLAQRPGRKFRCAG